MQSQQKYYIYARKSTDVEDKQALFIEAQLVELREYAKRENPYIAAEYIEKTLGESNRATNIRQVTGRN